MTRARNGWVLPVSLLLALLLGLVPLPAILQPLRPYWLALVLAYWVLEEPEKIGLGAAFLLGLVAVPLSRSSPRGGQQGGLPAAILLFAAYYNVSAIAKKLVAQGAIGVLPGVFWGQILLLVCLLLLNGRWLARWRRS